MSGRDRPATTPALLVAAAIAGCSALGVGKAQGGETGVGMRVHLVAEVGGQGFRGETICGSERVCALDIGRLDLARAVDRYAFAAVIDRQGIEGPMLSTEPSDLHFRRNLSAVRQVPLSPDSPVTCAALHAGHATDSPAAIRRDLVFRADPQIGWICVRVEPFMPPS